MSTLRQIKKQFRSVPCVKKNINAFHMSVVHKRMFLNLAVYPYVWLESIFIFRHHDSYYMIQPIMFKMAKY